MPDYLLDCNHLSAAVRKVSGSGADYATGAVLRELEAGR